MFTCQRISDVEYYIADETQEREQGKAAGRDRAAYYLDNGTGEDAGTWWSPPGNKPGSLVKRDTGVSPQAFRAMARGCDPRTGELLISTTRKERNAGYDCQFAAPKSVSVLWATATPEVRAKIEALQKAAVARALDFASAEGLIISRTGSAGQHKAPVADCAVATFLHTTSRAGDPQLHTHAVLLNVCEREDGSTGTLDNRRIMQYQGAMGAMYRAELAASLERELGLEIKRDERNFRVDGVPDQITELFSKRRASIEAAAAEAGYNTASDRERAQLTALATRDKKSDLPEREELERRWTRELKSKGWSGEAVWDSAKSARQKSQRERAEHGAEQSADRAPLRHQASEAAVNALTQNSAVIERRHVLREITERMQGIADASEALDEIKRMEETGALVQVGHLDDDEPVYATPEMIELERSMLRAAVERKAEREFVPAARIEAAISKRASMSEEQAEAVRHALNRDGVSVVEGSAGTGKSYSLGAVADAARDCGMRVYVVAPSHKAKDVVRADTTTDEDSAKALAGFNLRLLDERHREHISLSSSDCILVDEAGMVGTREMEVLLRHAKEAGAKVILAGDTRQLQPVTAGGPMAAIATQCGTQRIQEIRRQKVDWQRAASQDFASGHADRALQAYDRAGRLHLEESGKKAMEALARDWKADVERGVEIDMERPWEARLVVARRNAEVGLLNGILRESYREAGMLDAAEIELAAIARGQNGKLEPLKLSAGDRLIFGESVQVGGPGGVAVNNSDMGTLAEIGSGPDPFVKVRLDKGQVVAGRWSEFVGRRAEDAPPETRHPKIQHAYAITVHASQGTTVNKAFVFNAGGMGMESAYVGMTRHREDAAMYVDTSSIRTRLEAGKSGKVFGIDRKGRGAGSDTDEQPEAKGEVIREQIVKVLQQEISRSESKRNVSDFAKDKSAWLRGEVGEEVREKVKAETPTPSPISPAKADLVATFAAVDALVAAGAAPRARSPGNLVRPFGQRPFGQRPIVLPSVIETQEDRTRSPEAATFVRRMKDRKQGPAYPPAQPRGPITTGMRGLSPEQELQAFCSEIDLVRFLETRGYKNTEKWTNGWKMQNEGETLHIKRGGSGHTSGMWVWTRPDGSENGTIISYMQKVEQAGNLGQVRQQLRAYLGESLDGQRGDISPAPVQPSALAPERAYDFGRVRQYWNMMQAGANAWLMEARGLKRAVLERFQADIRTEGQGSKQNPGGVCFAHRNDAGEVVGYQRKGPRPPGQDASFSYWGSGGQKLSTRMGDRENPATIYIGEAAIDLISAYQLDGEPPHALLCALDGATSQEALEEVAKLVAKHPEARIRLAFDNDLPKERTNPHTGEITIVAPAGERMAQQVTEAIRVRAPDAKVERHFPPVDYKDWNDCLRGITRDQADEARLAAQAEAAAATRTAHAAEELHARSLIRQAEAADIAGMRRELREEIKSGSVSREQVIEREQQIERRAAELEKRRREEEAAIRAALDDIEQQQGQRSGLRR